MSGKNHHVLPELQNDLQTLGLLPGDVAIVQSSYKSLGIKDDTPSDVIHTLLDYLGDKGTLVMPVFSYNYAGLLDVKPFDPASSPGYGTGVLGETLRTWSGAVRSAHPTHSVAAVGEYALEITQDKANRSALGKGSSFEEAINFGAKIVLLGVNNSANSALHYAEAVAELPYNDIPYRAFYGENALVLKDGEPIEVPLVGEMPGCSVNFGVVDEYLTEKGIMRFGKVLSADTIIMDGKQMVAAVVEQLREKPDWLLCTNPFCEPCVLRRKRLRSEEPHS